MADGELRIPSPPMRPLSKPMSMKPKEVNALTVRMSGCPCNSTAPMVAHYHWLPRKNGGCLDSNEGQEILALDQIRRWNNEMRRFKSRLVLGGQ